MRLTKATVRGLTLPAGKGEVLFFDDALPGFGVRIRAGGSRSWIAQFRVGVQQRRVTLGKVEAVDAEEARRRARNALAQAHLGTDPQAERIAARAQAAVTLRSVVNDYMERHATPRLKASTLAEVDRYLRRHFKPLAETPIRKIERADVAARLARIAADHGGYAANRARAALGSLYAWSIAEGLTDHNPVVGTRKATAEVARDRVLTDAELSAAWRLAGDGDYGAILRLLVLTGQRRDEVGGMVWAEVDLAGKSWTLPKGRTKNGREHVVPLSAAALDILRGLPRREGSPLVFGSRKGTKAEQAGGFGGWSKAKAALDARMLAELREEHGPEAKLAPWRLHDLRRTAATRMAEGGVLPHVVEAVLNHVSGHKAGVAGVYNLASYAAEKRAALDLRAAQVMTLIGGEG